MRLPVNGVLGFCSALLLAASCGMAGAQPFPERPITMVVPFAAGGAADTTGRILAEGMSKVLGKAVIITDAPALLQAHSPHNYEKVLGLTSGAATVFDGSDMIANVETTNGKTRIETTMQVDYSFGLGLKGYTWDESNGGKSPTDAELATGSNWDKTATDIKNTAGVILVGDATVS